MENRTLKIIGGFLLAGGITLLVIGIIYTSIASIVAPKMSDSFAVFSQKMDLEASLSFTGMGFLAGGGFMTVFSIAILAL